MGDQREPLGRHPRRARALPERLAVRISRCLPRIHLRSGFAPWGRLEPRGRALNSSKSKEVWQCDGLTGSAHRNARSPAAWSRRPGPRISLLRRGHGCAQLMLPPWTWARRSRRSPEHHDCYPHYQRRRRISGWTRRRRVRGGALAERRRPGRATRTRRPAGRLGPYSRRATPSHGRRAHRLTKEERLDMSNRAHPGGEWLPTSPPFRPFLAPSPQRALPGCDRQVMKA